MARLAQSLALAFPLPPPPAGEEDKGLDKHLKKRKMTRQELDELTSATRRKKQQRLHFGKHFKLLP